MADKNDLKDLLRQVLDKEKANIKGKHSMDAGMQIDILKENVKAFHAEHKFEVGNIVRLKSALGKYHSLPELGQAGVVVDIFDPPLTRKSDREAAPYKGEKENLRVAFVDKKGEVIYFMFDSRRFEPWPEAEVVKFAPKKKEENDNN